MALVRAPKLIRSDLRTLIRSEALDPAVHADGTSKTSEELRFSDTDVDNCLRQQLKDMHNARSGWLPAENLLSEDLTVSGSADGIVDLPPSIGLSSAQIYKVEDLHNEFAVAIDYVSPLEIERYSSLFGTLTAARRRRYTILGGDDLTTTAMKIRLLPRISSGSTQVRIWYIAPAVLPGVDGDDVIMSDNWEEVIVLGSALRLLRRDDEATEQQLAAYAHLWQQYKAYSERQRGPMRIRRKRRGRS